MSKTRNTSEIMVVAACILMMTTAYEIAYAATYLFTVSITRDMGFERSVFVLHISIKGLATFLSSFFFSYCLKRFSLKRLILFGCAMFIASYLLFAVSDGLWMFYAGGFLAGVATTFLSSTTITIVINNWFSAKKGFIIGLVGSLSALTGIGINPFVGAMLSKFGWRATYVIMAVMCLLITLAIAVILRTDPPGRSAPREEARGRFSVNAALREYVRTLRLGRVPTFIAIGLLTAMSVALSYGNISSALQDIGFPVAYVSGVMLVALSLANCGGKLLMGIINDRAGVDAVAVLGYSCCALGSIIVAGLGGANTAAALIGVVAVGLSISMVTVPFPIMIARVYERSDYGGVLSVVMASYMLGQTIGNPLSNLIFDLTGSYAAAYYIQAALAVAAMTLCLRVTRFSDDGNSRLAARNIKGG